jgi:hypothetical protein
MSSGGKPRRSHGLSGPMTLSQKNGIAVFIAQIMNYSMSFKSEHKKTSGKNSGLCMTPFTSAQNFCKGAHKVHIFQSPSVHVVYKLFFYLLH